VRRGGGCRNKGKKPLCVLIACGIASFVRSTSMGGRRLTLKRSEGGCKLLGIFPFPCNRRYSGTCAHKLRAAGDTPPLWPRAERLATPGPKERQPGTPERRIAFDNPALSLAELNAGPRD